MKDKIIIIVSIIVVGFGAWRLLSSDLIAGNEVPAGARAMDIETGYRFRVMIGPDFKGWPVKSKQTGKMTGYPVEVCYWNQCGKEEGGTWVVLKEVLGEKGPTRCPVCGHIVVPHNPVPPGFFVDAAGNLQPKPDAANQAMSTAQDAPDQRGR